MTNKTENNVEPEAKVDVAADVRAKIFANAGKVKRFPFKFKDVDLEFVQPHIGKMYGSERTVSEGKSFIIMAMIENAVVPGTDEKVFSLADYEAIMEMPMSADMTPITQIISETFGLNVEEEAKN